MSDDPAQTQEPRYRPGAARRYRGAGIEVTWEPRLCTHAAECLQGAPEVFEARARPWVHLDGADPSHVAEVVARCPTGALHAYRTDGAPQEEERQAGVEIRVDPAGPLLVHGNVSVLDSDGKPLRDDVRLALCRCGASRHKPYCDGNHRLIGFRD
ncbi:MAG: (4Fe-4S)-binding protein [Actinomycetota bacterium]